MKAMIIFKEVWSPPNGKENKKSSKLFYTWSREGAESGPDGGGELLSQDFPTGEAAGVVPILLGSLDRADYLPPPAAAPAPLDVLPHLSMGHAENAG